MSNRFISKEEGTCRSTTGILDSRDSGDFSLPQSPPPPRRRSSSRSARASYAPVIEAFEDRCLLAPITWTGAQAVVNTNWSNLNNWSPLTVPTANDEAIFTGDHLVQSTVDTAFAGTVNKLTIESNYTRQITLQRSLTSTTIDQADGTIFGNTLIVPANGTFDWSGGTQRGLGSATTTIAANATLNIKGNARKNLDGRIIENSGTTVWTGFGDVTAVNAGKFNNLSGSVFRANTGGFTRFNGSGEPNTQFTVSSGACFTKEGTDTTTFNINFCKVGQGALTVTGGADSILRFLDGLVDISGNVTVEANTQLAFQSSTNTAPNVLLRDGVHINGTGTTWINRRVMVADNNSETVSVRNLYIESSGCIDGPGILDVTGSTTWAGGAMAGTGSTHFNANRVVNITGFVSINGRTIDNDGTMVWRGDGLTISFNSGTINNKSVFDIQNDQRMTAGGTFSNTGTLKKTDQFGQSRIECIVCQSGTLQLSSGTLKFSRDLTQLQGGQTLLCGGSLSVDGTFCIAQGSSLTGTGTISAMLVVNSGTISLGASIGVLSIAALPGVNNSGKYTQTGTGVLNMRVTATPESDRLNIAGEVTLAGTLNVTLIGPAPTQATGYTLLTFGSRPNPDSNRFTTHNLPSASWAAGYGATTMTVTFTP